MDNWKRQFIDRLGKAQAQCVRRFEEIFDGTIGPAFESLTPFLNDNGLRTSRPLHDQGRRSFKVELAENAYLLLIFRFQNLSEFELRFEIFSPGCEPFLKKVVARLSDVNPTWAEQQFRYGLDQFVDHLSGTRPRAPQAVETGVEELVAA